MSNTVQQLQVLLGADTTNFQAGMTKAEELLGRFGLSFNKMIGGLGFGALVAGVVEVGEKFEQANIKIQRATGATGEKLESLEKSIKNVYATSSKSAVEVADVLAKISQRTGETGVALEGLAKSALRFAKVTGSDLTASVDENQRLFAQWGVGTSQQSEKMDELYVVTTQTGASASTLAQTLLSSGAALRSFGFTFSEAAALAGNFAKHGLDLNNVLGALSRGMVNLADAGKNPREELMRLVERMQKASTEAEAVNVAAETFGKRGAVVLTDAVRRGAFNTGDLADKMKDARGSVADMADATKTLGDRFAELKHNIEAAVGPAGEAILKFANDGMKNIGLVTSLASGLMKGGWAWFSGSNAAPPALPNASEYVTNLPAPKSTGGGTGTFDAKSAFSALGLKDLRKELEEAVPAFRGLAAAGLLTHEQMLKAAESIQKLRQQLGQISGNQGYLSYVSALGQQWGTSSKMPSIAQLGALPSGMHGGVTQDDLAGLPQYSHFADIATGSLTALANALNLDARNQQIVTDAFHDFGMSAPDELKSFAQQAQDSFKLIQKSGTASAEAVQDAYMEMVRTQMAAQGKLGTFDGAIRGVRSFVNSMGRGIEDAFKQWKGFADGIATVFKRMGESILDMLLGALLKPVEKLFTNIVTEMFTKTAAQATATQAATSALNIGTVTSDAAVASAATFASISAIPIVGPFMAPEMAAAAYAQVMAMAPLAMFEQGGNVPADMPAFLHAKEMVLPADIAEGMRGMIAGGGAGDNGGVHFHSCSFGQNSMGSVVRQLRVAGARI